MAESSIELTSNKDERMTDEARIIQAARQSPKVFGELYKLYVEQVFRYLYSRIGNLHEAEDVTAQTFLSAFESFDNFRQDRHFASWLFGIAHNKAMDHFRRRNPSLQIDGLSEIPTEDNTLAEMIKSEQEDRLSKLIQALPEEDRELIRLRFLAEMSYPEIARLLHRNTEAVKKTTYRLLARLQSQLEDSNE